MDELFAATMQVPPGQGRSGGLADVIVVVVVLAVIAVCLFLFFRRGSIADRARRQELDDAERPPEPQ